MKKVALLLIALFFISVAAPASAIETNYEQIEYYEVFIRAFMAKQKKKDMIVQTQDGSGQVIAPKSDEEKSLEQ